MVDKECLTDDNNSDIESCDTQAERQMQNDTVEKEGNTSADKDDKDESAEESTGESTGEEEEQKGDETENGRDSVISETGYRKKSLG